MDEARIQGAAEAILYELKSVVRITDQITRMYDSSNSYVPFARACVKKVCKCVRVHSLT